MMYALKTVWLLLCLTFTSHAIAPSRKVFVKNLLDSILGMEEWTSLLPNGDEMKETANIIHKMKKIIIHSDNVPAGSTLSNTSILMDFTQGTMAVRLFDSQTKEMCVFTEITKDDGTFEDVESEIQGRKTSKEAIQHGTPLKLFALDGHQVRTQLELIQMGGLSVFRMCKHCLTHGKVYHALREAPPMYNPYVVRVSGFITKSQPRKSVPIEIEIEEESPRTGKDRDTMMDHMDTHGLEHVSTGMGVMTGIKENDKEQILLPNESVVTSLIDDRNDTSSTTELYTTGPSTIAPVVSNVPLDVSVTPIVNFTDLSTAREPLSNLDDQQNASSLISDTNMSSVTPETSPSLDSNTSSLVIILDSNATSSMTSSDTTTTSLTTSLDTNITEVSDKDSVRNDKPDREKKQTTVVVDDTTSVLKDDQMQMHKDVLKTIADDKATLPYEDKTFSEKIGADDNFAKRVQGEVINGTKEADDKSRIQAERPKSDRKTSDKSKHLPRTENNKDSLGDKGDKNRAENVSSSS